MILGCQNMTWKPHMVFRYLSIMQEPICTQSQFSGQLKMQTSLCLVTLQNMRHFERQALTDCFSSSSLVTPVVILMHACITLLDKTAAAGSLRLLRPHHIIRIGQRNVQLDHCQSCCRTEAPLARAAEGCAALALYQFHSAWHAWLSDVP